MFYRYLKAFGGVCASHTSATDMGTDWRDNDPEVEFEWTDQNAMPASTSYYYVRGDQQGTVDTRNVRSTQGETLQWGFDNGDIVWASPMWITYRP